MNSFNPVLGAIVGDIVGSIYESDNHKSKKFEFISPKCFFTDDTIHTLAIYDAFCNSLNQDDETIKKAVKDNLIKFSNMYPNANYAPMFKDWLYSRYHEPYNILGNGAAMRISSAAFMSKTLDDCKRLSKLATVVTHNNDDGLRGAECVSTIIFTLLSNNRTSFALSKVRSLLKEYYPNFGYADVDTLRKTYQFNKTCEDTVPQAVVCFLEAVSFEDAIRNAISIGGDSDTIGAITGSMAAAFYSIPKEIEKLATDKLDDFLFHEFEACNEIRIREFSNK